MLEYLLWFELQSVDEAGLVQSQWVSVALQGELGTVAQLQSVALQEGAALSHRYGIQFGGIGEMELLEV